MESNKQHFRHILLYYYRKGKNAVQARKKLTDLYGENVMTVRQCQNWFAKFRSGNFDVEDAPRSGRPVEADEDAIKALVETNRGITTREIGSRLNLSNSTVYEHMKSLGLTPKLNRKSEKGKLRVKKRKEEKLRLEAALEVVKKANEVKDPLADFTAFSKFENNGIKAYLEFQNVQDIDKDTLQSILKLEKDNMESMYNSCSWGWNEENKFKEMTEETAKYLIAKDETGNVIGFCHFRFDMDYGDEVLYCYELQLDQKIRRKGLGKFMMQVLELIAFKNNMRKVVLTVLKHNLNAVNFFHSLKYEIDETNPEESVLEDIPYQILSKKNKRLPPVSSET